MFVMWSEQSVSKMVELAAENKTYAEIAAIFGVNPTSVAMLFKRRNLPRPNRSEKIRAQKAAQAKYFCNACKQTDPAEFYVGNRSLCKACKIERQLAYQRTDGGKATMARASRQYLYKLPEARYLELLAEQGGVCALCKQPEKVQRLGVTRPLSVDHDHACCPGKRTCGKCVRGLICHECNAKLEWCINYRDAVDEYLSRPYIQV